MINIEVFIPFIIATTLILIIPGPTIILVISQAVAHGRRSVTPLVIGVLLGDFTAMTLSLLGLGAMLSASAALYAIFAGQLSEHMRKPRVRKWFDRCGGSALIGAGLLTAGMQRTSP